MAIRKLKPNTPATRFYSIATFEEVTKTTPEKSLLAPLKKSGGRNNHGRITSRHRGGGHKRRYRIIDFKREKHGVPARVEAIEYDPNRTARIALLVYADGEKRYILAPNKVQVGDTLMSGPEAEVRDGNCMPLNSIPVGTFIHAIEMKVGKGAQIARSAGIAGQIAAKEGPYALVKMPSGEMRLIKAECTATIGVVGNSTHENISWGKAGRMRWKGVRPQTRGMCMNPVDHPNGGGEGKSKSGGGHLHPVSPWGKPAKGGKTRKRKKLSNKYIVRSRKK